MVSVHNETLRNIKLELEPLLKQPSVLTTCCSTLRWLRNAIFFLSVAQSKIFYIRRHVK